MRDTFSKLDLNLLKTLQVLAQEQHMGRAAERLFVTQPAVSQALGRLRAVFNDPLFVKTPQGLSLTPFGNDLVERISPVLSSLASAVNHQQKFEPYSVHQTIKLAVSPHLIQFISLHLYKYLKQQAPNIKLEVVMWDKQSQDHLTKEQADLGITLSLNSVPKLLAVKQIGEDVFTGFVRNGHVLADKPSVSLEQLSDFEIASLIIPDWNESTPIVDSLFKIRGLKAKVGFRSSIAASIFDVLESSDMVYPASSFYANYDNSRFSTFEVSLAENKVTVPIMVYYHQKHKTDPLYQWIIKALEEILYEN